VSGGATASFVYDGDGNRVKGTVNGVTTVYVGSHYEYNVNTGVATSYYYAGSTRVAMRQGGVVSYLHGDHLGSASLTTDASGTPTSQLRYLPYGAPRPGYPTGNVPTDYRFTGQRSEEASLGSLYDFGARMYSPVLGRFLSADTIVPSPGNPQALNRYSYVLNNPLAYKDPNGHWPIPNAVAMLQSTVNWLDAKMNPATDIAAGLTVEVANQLSGREIVSLPTMERGANAPSGHQAVIGTQAGANYLAGLALGHGYNAVADFAHNQVGLFETTFSTELSGNVNYPMGGGASAVVIAGAGPIYGFEDPKNKSIDAYAGWSTSGGWSASGGYGAYADVSFDGWQSGLPFQPSGPKGSLAQGGIGIGTPGVSVNSHVAISYSEKQGAFHLPEFAMRAMADTWWFFETQNGSTLQLDDPRRSVRQY
jgi:RHS repeat-associated protein